MANSRRNRRNKTKKIIYIPELPYIEPIDFIKYLTEFNTTLSYIRVGLVIYSPINPKITLLALLNIILYFQYCLNHILQFNTINIDIHAILAIACLFLHLFFTLTLVYNIIIDLHILPNLHIIGILYLSILLAAYLLTNHFLYNIDYLLEKNKNVKYSKFMLTFFGVTVCMAYIKMFYDVDGTKVAILLHIFTIQAVSIAKASNFLYECRHDVKYLLLSPFILLTIIFNMVLLLSSAEKYSGEIKRFHE